MLRSTFRHLPGIGFETEHALWREGVRDWADLLAELPRCSVGSACKETVRRKLMASEKALAEGNHQFFARSLKLKEAWRAWPEFRSKCVYLDIETDGRSANGVTVIGIWDGRHHHALIQGESLGSFRDLISNASMIVTFHGSGFDLPVLKKRYKDIPLDQIHFDLCPALRSVDVRGGLKKIETEMGIERPESIRGLGGYDAVKLWRRYRVFRDEGALATLIAYNRADCANMERLAEIAYERLRARALWLAGVDPLPLA